MTIDTMKNLLENGLTIAPEKLGKIKLDDIDFIQGEQDLDRWISGVMADVENDYLVPMFIAQNQEAGTYAFFNNGSGISGVKIEDSDKIAMLRDGVPTTKVKELFDPSKVMGEGSSLTKLKEAKQELVGEITESASQLTLLSPSFTGDKVTKRAGIKAVYALFKSQGVDIEEVLSESKSLYGQLIGSILEREQNIANKPPGVPLEEREVPDAKEVSFPEERKETSPALGKLDDFDYEDLIEARNKQKNKEAKKQRSTLFADPHNPAQKNLLEIFKEGKNILSFGEAGTGKTRGITDFSRRNKIETHTVNFHADVRAADMVGRPDLVTLPGESQNTILKRDGMLTSAIRAASERAKEGKLTTFIGDDFLRADSLIVSVFIANMSTHGASPLSQEYRVDTAKGLAMAMIETNLGDAWFVIGKDIDRKNTRHKIFENGDSTSVVINKDDAMFVYDGTSKNAAERFSRGDLLYMSEDDYQKVKSNGIEFIQKTAHEKETLYVPESSLLAVMTANTGDYEINIEKLDPAFLRRFLPAPLEPDSIKHMVNTIHKSWIKEMDWDKKTETQVKDIMHNFFEMVEKMANNNDGVEIAIKPMYAVIQSFYTALRETDPLKNIEEMMKRQAGIFVPFEVTESAEVYKEKNTHKFLEETIRQTVKGTIVSKDAARDALAGLDIDTNISTPSSGRKR